jgi:hypothetical protein
MAKVQFKNHRLSRRLCLVKFMKIIFFAILLSLAPITYSKEVCIASENLNVMKIFFELTGEQNQAIVFNLELIEANLRAISHIDAGKNFEFIESLD